MPGLERADHRLLTGGYRRREADDRFGFDRIGLLGHGRGGAAEFTRLLVQVADLVPGKVDYLPGEASRHGDETGQDARELNELMSRDVPREIAGVQVQQLADPATHCRRSRIHRG